MSLDAINLYEQMAALVQNDDIRSILLDVAREEKTHVGEFQSMLLKADSEHAEELKAGEREVREKSQRRSAAAFLWIYCQTLVIGIFVFFSSNIGYMYAVVDISIQFHCPNMVFALT